MPARSKEPFNYFQDRFKQISESHCGPAVIQMQLSLHGLDVRQEQVAEAGGASSLIEMNGMRVDQLARAVRRLAPHLRFYYKERATLDDLVRIVADYRYPVGVEWQGVFEDEDAARYDRANSAWKPSPPESPLLPLDSESSDSDYGHYSLVTGVNRRKRLLTVADPYKDFYSRARIFDFDLFDRRWYDYNEVPDPVTGGVRLVMDDHLMFVITRPGALFPRKLGMVTF